MARLNASTPGYPRPDTGSSDFGQGHLVLLVLLILWPLGTASGANPDYLRVALDQFSGNVPAGWAYTQMTVRNGDTTTERFDPSRPGNASWSLLRFNGHEPTARELKDYIAFKAANTTPAAQISFRKADIDPDHLEKLRENAGWVEYSGTFRASAIASDKMLGHLNLRLVIHKSPAYVEKITLELKQPYSPVLGVKMTELQVQTVFSAPEPGRPSLPATTVSHYRGRIFLLSTDEDMRVRFVQFTSAAGLP